MCVLRWEGGGEGRREGGVKMGEGRGGERGVYSREEWDGVLRWEGGGEGRGG